MADPGRLDELKRKFDENPRRYFAPLANEYRKAGEPDMAIELCRTYLPQQPSHMSGYIVYGQALHDAGRDEEAAAVFNQALSLDPENIIALRQLGDIARTAGDGTAALQWYRKVLELDPRNDEIASFIGALESPGTAAPREWAGPERPVPPPVRPEPEADGTAVALEDLVSQPDVPRTTPAAPVPVPHPEPEAEGHAEPETEPAAPEAPAEFLPEVEETPAPPSLVELTFEADTIEADTFAADAFEADAFEAVHWPTATPDEQRTVEEDLQGGTSEEIAPETEKDEAAHELLRFSDFVPEAEPAAPAELVTGSHMEMEALDSPHSSQLEAPEATAAGEPTAAESAQYSPFVTETMAELYLQQGLRAEALAIYRQLLERRDDPVLRQRIAELEHTVPAPDAAEAADAADAAEPVMPAARGESVRAFFARIGSRQPGAHAHIAAEGEGGLATIFSTNAMDDADIAAAQSLAGAFATPERVPVRRD